MKMGKFTVYNKTNGQLMKIVNCPDKSIQVQCDKTEYYIQGSWDDSLYMMDLDLGKIIQKPEIPVETTKTQIVADGIDEAVITLPTTEPNGTVIGVEVDGYNSPQVISDGKLILTSNIPKKLTLEFRAINYLPKTLTIEAI